jgi:hypothetical protein
MRLPSFRVHTLMAAVVVVVLIIWGSMMGTRSYAYYKLARDYSAIARNYRGTERDWQPVTSNRPAWMKSHAEYAEFLSAKYHRTMWRPWSPVTPDPPVPGPHREFFDVPPRPPGE